MQGENGLPLNSVLEVQQSTQVETISEELMVDRLSAEVLASNGLEPGIPEDTIERQDFRDLPPHELERELPLNATESPEYTIERQEHRDPRPLHDLEIQLNEPEIESRRSAHRQEETTRKEQTITRLDRRSPVIISPEADNLIGVDVSNQATTQLESQADLSSFNDIENEGGGDTQQIIRRRDQRNPPPINSSSEEAIDGQASIASSSGSARYAANTREPETLPQRPIQRVQNPRRADAPPIFSFVPILVEGQHNPFSEARVLAGKKRKRETTDTADTNASISIPPIRGMQPQVPKRRKAPNTQ
jgi:hypothetical protein